MQKNWKVLIADDEPVIREGIREAVDWQKLQMEVVDEAEDGEEALELALEHMIDILLVDLNMPIMNGITLIKHIREHLPQCKIIIISGHDEFTYAQEAIRLNVHDYILKPVNPQQLINVLESVCKELETTLQQNEYFKMASTQITKNFEMLREKFCLEWINYSLEEKEIMEQLQFLNLPIECPKRLGLLQYPEFYSNKPLMSEKDKDLFTFSTKNIVFEILQPFQTVFFSDNDGFMVILLWDDVSEDILFQLKHALKAYLKITVNLYFQYLEGKISELADYYKGCKEMMEKTLDISPIVRRAREYIQNHFSNQELTLESIAEYLQVSPVYLSRIIKQDLGTSFVSILTEMRIKKAIHLLNSTDLSIYEIAELVGYDSQHYFSTAFKKVMGVSPNKYRKGVFS